MLSVKSLEGLSRWQVLAEGMRAIDCVASGRPYDLRDATMHDGRVGVEVVYQDGMRAMGRVWYRPGVKGFELCWEKFA